MRIYFLRVPALEKIKENFLTHGKFETVTKMLDFEKDRKLLSIY